MKSVLLVGAGGFVGSAGRYLVAGWVHRFLGTPWVPYGTLVVNTLGCLLIGFLVGLTEFRQVFAPDTRIFVFIGILGGFTTFSTFGLETFALARDGEFVRAGANVLLQVVLGLACVWAGYSISKFV